MIPKERLEEIAKSESWKFTLKTEPVEMARELLALRRVAEMAELAVRTGPSDLPPIKECIEALKAWKDLK